MYQEDMINQFDGCGGMIINGKPTTQQKPRRPPQRRSNKESFQLREVNLDKELLDHEYEEKKVNDILPNHNTRPTTRQLNNTRDDAATLLPKPKINIFQKPLSITVGKVIPWSKNSTRTVARAGSSSYYAVYIHEVDLDARYIKVKLMAMGEWNMPSPKSTLFCVYKTQSETWEGLAAQERQWQKQKVHYASRFDRAQWHPQCESRGFFEGCLLLPRSFLGVVEQQQQQTQWQNVTLAMRYAATTPWQQDYAVVKLLQIEPHAIICPRNKLPVPPTDPWSPVFPRDVLERFQKREISSS